MKKFMELLECDFRSGENKYCLLKSPEGFTSFQIHEDYGKSSGSEMTCIGKITIM